MNIAWDRFIKKNKGEIEEVSLWITYETWNFQEEIDRGTSLSWLIHFQV